MAPVIRPPGKPPVTSIKSAIRPAPVLARPAVPAVKPAGTPIRRIVQRPIVAAAQAPVATARPSNDGFAQARAINADRDARSAMLKHRCFDFFMKRGEGGIKGVTVMLLDTVVYPKLPFFHYCHHWGFESGSVKEEECIKDGAEPCPLCGKFGKEGTHQMELTIIDKRPVTFRKGEKAGKTVAFSRKRFTIKTGMIPKYERLFMEQKSFRGCVLQVFRDGDKAPASGSDFKFVTRLPEAEIRKFGAVDSVPMDYAKAFPYPTAEMLATRYNAFGGNAVGGEEFSGAAGGVDADSIPF